MLKIKTSLYILGLAVVGVTAAASQAHAQIVDVPFMGTVGNACTFGTPTAGTLARTTGRKAMAASAGISGVATVGGTAGSVNVLCTNGGTVTVAPPTLVASPAAFTPTKSQSVVQLQGTTSATSASTGARFTGWTSALFPTAPLAITNVQQTLEVGMIVGDDDTATTADVPAGTYEYTVAVTATPN